MVCGLNILDDGRHFKSLVIDGCKTFFGPKYKDKENPS